MKCPYLVCYDIRDDRRLQRVFSFMKSQGLHLQYSVFYCELTWPELQALKNKLNEMINPLEDDVRIYPLQKDSLVAVLGCGEPLPEGITFLM